MSAAVSYDTQDEQLLSLWLYACQCELAARQGTGSPNEARAAWARLADACVNVAPLDAAIYRALARRTEQS